MRLENLNICGIVNICLNILEDLLKLGRVESTGILFQLLLAVSVYLHITALLTVSSSSDSQMLII